MAFLFAAVTPSIAVTPIKLTSISSLRDLGPATHLPYRDADAERVVNTAIAHARAQHKLAFIVLGANWSAQCRTLAAFLSLPEVRRFMRAHYVVARVEVGHYDRNLQIPARWGIVDRLSGLPTVIIVDPSDNSIVNRGRIADLARIDRMTAQQIASWIVWWAK